MFLILEIRGDDTLVFHLGDADAWIQKVAEGKRGSLVKGLDRVFKELNCKISDLKGMGVLFNGMSFTVSRAVATVANSLAFACSIPVVEIDKVDYKKFLKVIESKESGKYILPRYSGEARIGK